MAISCKKSKADKIALWKQTESATDNNNLMTTLRNILTISILTISSLVNGQTFDKTITYILKGFRSDIFPNSKPVSIRI